MAKLSKEQLAQLMQGIGQTQAPPHESTPNVPSYLTEEDALGVHPLYAQYGGGVHGASSVQVPSPSYPQETVYEPSPHEGHTAASALNNRYEPEAIFTDAVSEGFYHNTASSYPDGLEAGKHYGLPETSIDMPPPVPNTMAHGLPLAETLQEDLQALRASAYEEASQQGYQDGYEAGLQQGYQEAEQRLEEQLLTLHEGIESILSVKEKAFESVKEELLPLVYQLVEKIIKTEATCDPDLVLHLVKDCLRQSDRNAKQLIIHVHPDNLVTVEQWVAEHPNPFRLEGKLLVEENLNVELGSCMIETKNGMLDARFSTQLDSLKSLLGLNQTVVGAPIQASDNPS
ncbi:MAG: FliH/SctL family protein [Vampirovibrionales bacterium]